MAFKIKYPAATVHDYTSKISSKTYWAGGKPIGVLNHVTAVCGSTDPGAGRFSSESIGPAFGINRAGVVFQYYDLADFATWHAFGASHYYIGIEHETDLVSCILTVAELEASVKLNAWLADQFGFSKVRSPGVAFKPGIKCHADGLEKMSVWDEHGHYCSVWKATGDAIDKWVSSGERTNLNRSPWSVDQFMTAVKGGEDELLDPKKDAAVFSDMLDERISNANIAEGFVKGMTDANQGKVQDPKGGVYYDAGYTIVKGMSH